MNSLQRRLIACAMLVAMLFFPAGLAAPHSGLQAQQDAPGPRVVQGKVLDKDERPLKDAIIYLKNTRTLTVRSYVSADDGTYRFVQLAQNTDYEIWAVYKDKKSAVKSISSFDTKTQFNLNLKIETAK
jgi:hypothetical protein